MARTARRYDLDLPLTFNDGRPIPVERFEQVERRLLERFGGVTSQQRDFPLRGIWQGEAQLYLDQAIVMTALDFRRQGSARFITGAKRDLLRQFEQLEILITESTLRVYRAGHAAPAFFRTAGWVFHRRCSQKYCSGCRRTSRSSAL